MLTVEALRRADPAGLADTGAAWRRLADALTTQTAGLDRHLAALRAGWTGTAATAAASAIDAVCGELDGTGPQLHGIAEAVTAHADAIGRAGRLVAVDPAGAVALARSSDDATVASLTALGPTPARTPRVPLGDPPAGAAPQVVADWWAGLSPDQRGWLLTCRPDLIGNLDGIPADARDLANRARLAALLTDPAAAHQASLCGIRARLDAPGPPRAYLLGLSTAGTGRAIVAFGDPDTADHVATYVPGVGGDLATGLDEIDRASHLAAAARRAAPDRSTSVVAWLGYDAPTSLVGAAHPGAALAAVPDLHRFQAGLRATHLGTPAHQTVVGLSYGSTVVGLTGQRAGLLADDVVLIGSPGAGVAHAADLGVDTSHVWASTARHDAINAAVAPRDLLRPDLNPLLRPLFGEHSDRLWYGPSPTSQAFGAQVFSSAPGSWLNPVAAHLGYFDPSNPALTDMADITTGDYAGVR